MLLTNNTNGNYNPKQLKLPLEIEKIIDISDPVYSFSEIVDSIDFTSYFAKKESKTGRPKYNPTFMLKIILISFIVHDYEGVNLKLVWEIIECDLPQLRENLKKLK